MLDSSHILSILKRNMHELQKFGVSDIGVFGSYVRGDQTPNSDIDIFVDFLKGEENFDNLMALYDILESLFQNQRIEIVSKNGLSVHIGPKIMQEVIYA